MDKAKIIAQTSITAEKLRDPEFLIKYVRAGLPIEDYYAIRDLALLGLESARPEVARSGETPRANACAAVARGRDIEQQDYYRMLDLSRQLERELSEARFRPVGDNHHNALACPYCTPSPLLRSQEKP